MINIISNNIIDLIIDNLDLHDGFRFSMALGNIYLLNFINKFSKKIRKIIIEHLKFIKYKEKHEFTCYQEYEFNYFDKENKNNQRYLIKQNNCKKIRYYNTYLLNK